MRMKQPLLPLTCALLVGHSFGVSYAWIHVYHSNLTRWQVDEMSDQRAYISSNQTGAGRRDVQKPGGRS